MEGYDAPCFSHESMLTSPGSSEYNGSEFPGRPEPKPVTATTNEPLRKSSSSPLRRWTGDSEGIQINIGARLREYLDCLNSRKFDVIGHHIADTLERNNHIQTRQEHINRLRLWIEGLAAFQIKIDTLLVDQKAKAVAVRYINRVTLVDAMMYVENVGRRYEFDERCFVWFDDKGKIARVLTLQDNDGIRRQMPKAGMTPRFFSRSTPQKPVDLVAVYRKYISSINHGTMSKDFPHYCKREVRHNNRVMPVEEYWRSIKTSQEAISGLRFEIQELLVDEETQQVAARLQITGTPVLEFLGARPNGKSVKFHEHCMYRFDGGKIALVWATMELDSYCRQLEEKPDLRKLSILATS